MFKRLCDLVDASPSARRRPYDEWSHMKAWVIGSSEKEEEESVSIRKGRGGCVLLKMHLVTHTKNILLSKQKKHLFLYNVAKQIRVLGVEKSVEGHLTMWLKLTKAKKELACAAVEFLLQQCAEEEPKRNYNTESDE